MKKAILMEKRFSGWLIAVGLGFFLVCLYPLQSWGAEESYPNQPINMIIAYGPGSSADLGSKIIGDKISEFLGQPLISIFKPGGGGSLGASYAAKAKPDGYTVLIASASMIIIPPIVKKVDFKMEDFILLGSYSKIPIWMVVKKDARWKTLRDFVEEVKKTPAGFQMGTYGKLSASDFVLELFNRHAGIKLINLPFKSTAENLTNLLGGHIQACIVAGTSGHLQAGTVRILAVSDEKRLEGLPDVPTFSDMGYPVATPALFTFAFPKATPRPIVDRFMEAQKKAIKKYGKEITERMRRIEQFTDFRTAQDTQKAYREQHDTYFKLAQELGWVVK